MPKSSSPSKIVDAASTSAKAKFFYIGAFAMLKRKDQLSQPRPTRQSQDKKAIRK